MVDKPFFRCEEYAQGIKFSGQIALPHRINKVGYRNVEAMCFLWNENLIAKYYLAKFIV
jgi:hypothetical protein